MSETVEMLQTVGIKATDYKRGPVGKVPFIVSVKQNKQGGELRIWEGNSKIEIFPNKENRQAVLNVKENPRVLRRRISTTWFGSHKPSLEEQHTALKNDFSINMTNARFTFDKVTCEKDTSNWASDKYWSVHGTVTARTNSRKVQSFLVGFDEKHHFVSLLPTVVQSVDEAHKVLRPDGVTKDAIRQGEWFFQPVSQKLIKELDKIVKTHPQRLITDSLEEGSSHLAKQLLNHNSQKYVIGFVIDERSHRHEGIFLSSWHKVFRNKEQVMQNNRSETWD